MFDASVDLEEMGRRLDRARQDAGMSIFDLVVATKINETQVRKYLKGTTEPGATKVARLAEVLGVSADWILQTTDNPAPAGEVWVEGKTPDRRASSPNAGVPLEEMKTSRRRVPRRRTA